MDVPRLALLLLAAGASSRMRGADKLLQEVDSLPLLRRQAMAGRAAGLLVLVTLPPDRPARRDALAGLDITIVPVPDAADGMGASIRRGVAALPDGMSGVVVLPADMPEIDAAALKCVAAEAQRKPGHVLRAASQDGRLGHPVLFPSRCFKALRQLSGDLGARAILRGEEVVPVALPDEAALTDLDTPEAWANWRAQRP